MGIVNYDSGMRLNHIHDYLYTLHDIAACCFFLHKPPIHHTELYEHYSMLTHIHMLRNYYM